MLRITSVTTSLTKVPVLLVPRHWYFILAIAKEYSRVFFAS